MNSIGNFLTWSSRGSRCINCILSSTTTTTTTTTTTSPNSAAAKTALVLAAALALGTAWASAFVVPSSRSSHINMDKKSKLDQHQQWRLRYYSSPLWRILPSQPFLPTVHCEAHQPLSNTDLLEEEPNSNLPYMEDLTTNNGIYKRMNPPSRMEEQSHAIVQLLQPHKLECYELYRHVINTAKAAPISTSSIPSSSHVVTALVRVGGALDGHPGIIHGGILALLLDDIFGFAFWSIGVPTAFTANLNLDYRAALPSNSTVLIHVFLERWENRKLYFRADIKSLDGTTVYTEATSLYIIPRAAWNEMGLDSEEVDA